MLATYLTGERVALRAVQLADKDNATAWYESAFPVSAEQAEKYLNEELNGLTRSKLLLVIVRAESGEVVGGVRLRLQPRHSDISIQMAPALADADELRGEAVRLLVPWLADEGEHIAVSLDVAADQPQTIEAAEAVGMEQTARIREWYLHDGRRVDRLIYQAINPRWRDQEVQDA